MNLIFSQIDVDTLSKLTAEKVIIQLKEFVFNDSIGGGSMFCSIKNLNKPNEIRQSKIDVVKKEGRWLIASSSEFFKVFQGDKKKKSFQEKKDGIN